MVSTSRHATGFGLGALDHRYDLLLGNHDGTVANIETCWQSTFQAPHKLENTLPSKCRAIGG